MSEEVPKVGTKRTVDAESQSRVNPAQLRKLERQLAELERIGEAPRSTYRISHPFDTRIGDKIRGEAPVVSGSDLRQY